jgi:hypothetical protein
MQMPHKRLKAGVYNLFQINSSYIVVALQIYLKKNHSILLIFNQFPISTNNYSNNPIISQSLNCCLISHYLLIPTTEISTKTNLPDAPIKPL